MMEEEQPIDPKVQEYLNQLRQQGQEGQQPMLADSSGALPKFVQGGAQKMRNAFSGKSSEAPMETPPPPADDFQPQNPNKGGLGFMDRAMGGALGKKVPTKVLYSRKTNQSKLIFGEGPNATEQIIQGPYKYGQ